MTDETNRPDRQCNTGTDLYRVPAPAAVGRSLWCEPCYVRLGIMDGTAAFSDAMARLGESAS